MPQLSEVRPQRSLQEISDGLEKPGFSVKKSIEQARISGNYGQGGTGGDSLRNFDNRQANFSVERPTILSDTLGVDFWKLASAGLLSRARQLGNGQSSRSESAVAPKGRSAMIFNIHTNGRIDNLQVVRSSGLISL